MTQAAALDCSRLSFWSRRPTTGTCNDHTEHKANHIKETATRTRSWNLDGKTAEEISEATLNNSDSSWSISMARTIQRVPQEPLRLASRPTIDQAVDHNPGYRDTGTMGGLLKIKSQGLDIPAAVLGGTSPGDVHLSSRCSRLGMNAPSVRGLSVRVKYDIQDGQDHDYRMGLSFRAHHEVRWWWDEPNRIESSTEQGCTVQRLGS